MKRELSNAAFMCHSLGALLVLLAGCDDLTGASPLGACKQVGGDSLPFACKVTTETQCSARELGVPGYPVRWGPDTTCN